MSDEMDNWGLSLVPVAATLMVREGAVFMASLTMFTTRFSFPSSEDVRRRFLTVVLIFKSMELPRYARFAVRFKRPRAIFERESGFSAKVNPSRGYSLRSRETVSMGVSWV
jgi:hypothetical protein